MNLALLCTITLSAKFSSATNSCPNEHPPTGAIFDGNALDWVEAEWNSSGPSLEDKTNFARESIEFFVFDTSNNRQTIQVDNDQSLESSGYVSNIPLKVLIHGFLSTSESDFPKDMTNAFLRSSRKTSNILQVNWGDLAGSWPWQYGKALSSLHDVAGKLAKLLVYLKQQGALASYDDVHLIGFSLGAHVAGLTGVAIFDQTTMKVGKITGLDPAGPNFGSGSSHEWARLNPDNANFVEVIHTNAGLYGTELACGHVDLYPNGGGRRQPGCIINVCSHNFAHKMFIQLIDNPSKYKACKCEPWNWNKNGECMKECPDSISVGNIEPTVRGSYFFATT